jgi:recombination protein RecA
MAAAKPKKGAAALEGGGNASLIAALIEKHGALVKIGESDLSVRKVATGIWTLDETLSGGIPMAKITEIHGAAGAGKTSLACKIGASMQAHYPERYVVYIDAESALDERLAMEIYGLDPERTLIVRPDIEVTAEKLMDILVDSAMNPGVCTVVLDSVAGLVTEGEMKRQGKDVMVAPVATLLGRTIKKLSSRQDPEAAAVLLLNQMRYAIGNTGITTPGGSAVEFYPSLRLRLRRGDPVKQSEEEIGFICRCQVMKARYSPNRLVTGWSVIYGEEGISTLRSIVTVAMDQGLIVQKGAWFSITGLDLKWQGMEKLLEALRSDASTHKFVVDNLRPMFAPEAE